jgi:hypothetical protein
MYTFYTTLYILSSILLPAGSAPYIPQALGQGAYGAFAKCCSIHAFATDVHDLLAQYQRELDEESQRLSRQPG